MNIKDAAFTDSHEDCDVEKIFAQNMCLEKTNNEVSEQVGHKSSCTGTEDG